MPWATSRSRSKGLKAKYKRPRSRPCPCTVFRLVLTADRGCLASLTTSVKCYRAKLFYRRPRAVRGEPFSQAIWYASSPTASSRTGYRVKRRYVNKVVTASQARRQKDRSGRRWTPRPRVAPCEVPRPPAAIEANALGLPHQRASRGSLTMVWAAQVLECRPSFQFSNS
ncbi:MAG: hypothetical protein J3K34DRAFT_410568 [Monoraphidium minutum]|nr:MAG: hypothetical protein J3K34DRAFT_410568 [Monoraphidium minutum]